MSDDIVLHLSRIADYLVNPDLDLENIPQALENIHYTLNEYLPKLIDAVDDLAVAIREKRDI